MGHRHLGTRRSRTAHANLPEGTQSIQRALTVLRILATAREAGLGLTEIAMHAALPHPTVHRILSILVSEGIVEQKSSTRRYAVGEQIPLLALSRRTRDPLVEVASPHLRTLARDIGDTGFLTRRSGLDTVCVARHLGSYPIQVIAWDVGERRPLGITNAGIAILSGMQSDMAHSLLEKNQLRLLRYGVSIEEVLREAAVARARGFARRARALTPGTSAVSVVIRSTNGAALAALTINQISRRLTLKRTDEIVQQLRMHAEAIESGLRKVAISRSARS